MSSNFPFCFAILAFGRSEDLSRVIAQISNYFPEPRIVVLIDKYEGVDEVIREANERTIEIGRKLLACGDISHLEFPESNLRTKRAWKVLMEVSFGFADSVVYVEDDLLFINNPVNFLSWADEVLLNSSDVAFATLYTSQEHRIQFPDRGRLTNWPESWGVVIRKEKYDLLQQALSEARIHGLQQFEFFARHPNSYVVRLMGGRFRKVWLYKFQKALTSDTAWDTELHLGIWLLGLKSLAPNISYLEDTGVHFTSVSTVKSPRSKQVCKRTMKNHTGDLNSAKQLTYCKACEKKSEKRDYMFLPQVLKNFLNLNPRAIPNCNEWTKCFRRF